MALDNQIFLSENLITTATITADSENAQYPLSNLLDDRRTKTYRSTSNSTTVKLDFGIPRDVDVLAFVTNGFDNFSFTSCTLELNNVDVWTAPPFTTTVTIDALNGFGYTYLDTVQTYRYARLIFTGTAGYVEVAKCFIGKSAQVGDLSFNYPLDFNINDNATITKNRIGQRFIDEISTQRLIAGSINTMTKEEFQPLLDVIKYSSITKPIWLIFPEGNITEDNDQVNGMYYLTTEPKPKFVQGNFWNISLSFEEAM